MILRTGFESSGSIAASLSLLARSNSHRRKAIRRPRTDPPFNLTLSLRVIYHPPAFVHRLIFACSQKKSYQTTPMTKIEAMNQGRLYAIELLLTQALVERFRCIDDQQKVDDSARMLAEIASAVASQPVDVQTGAMDTAKRLLEKAASDSVNYS